ncbi:MAG: heme NO-binding domain-containing protein [Bradymonadia bacterium]
MYGMVNDAVRGLVRSAFGEEAWKQIHTKADAPESFVAMQTYDDEVTYNLVGAAVEVLQLDAETVLQTFGKYWVSDVATEHYASLMSNTGISFVDFVKNLDHMHQRIRTTFPDYQPPSFRVIDIGDDRIQVDYYSKREGLLPFVEGLFDGLATHFNTVISITHQADDSHPLPCKRMIVQYKTK